MRIVDKAKKRKQALDWWHKYGRNKDIDGKRSILDPTEDRAGFFLRARFLKQKTWSKA